MKIKPVWYPSKKFQPISCHLDASWPATHNLPSPEACKAITWGPMWNLHFISYSSTRKQPFLAHKQQKQAGFISGCQRICFRLDHECSSLMLTRCLESSIFHTICKWCYWIYWILSSTQPRGTVCISTWSSEEILLQCPRPKAPQVQKVTKHKQLLHIT